MSENLIWWGVQLFVSLLDFVIIYIIAHALIIKWLKIRKEDILLWITYTIVSSLAFYSFNGWSARIFSHILLILMIKRILKRASWNDMLIIYMLWFIMLGFVQGIIISTLGWFPISRFVILFMGQLFTAVAIFVLCKKFKWYGVFHTIRSHMLLKMFLFIFATGIIITASIMNFEFDVTYILFSTTAVVLVLASIFPMLLKLYQLENGIISSADLKTDLWLTALDMIDEPDTEKHYEIYAELAGRYGKDVANFVEEKKILDAKTAYEKEIKAKIKTFLDDRIEQSENQFKIDSDVMYSGEYGNITVDDVLRWLGVLLDTAFNLAKNPLIYVRLFALQDSFSLEVAFACDADSDVKNKIGFDLHEEVKHRGGIVSFNKYEIPEDECYCTEILIEIKNGDSTIS